MEILSDKKAIICIFYDNEDEYIIFTKKNNTFHKTTSGRIYSSSKLDLYM